MNQPDTQGDASASEQLPPLEHVVDALKVIPKQIKFLACDYLKYPHRHKALREFLTLESLPLKPRIFDNIAGDNGLQLIWQLFAIPSNQNSLNEPWLAAFWAWPEMDLVRVEKLGGILSTSNLPLSIDCVMSGDYHAAFCKALRKDGPWPNIPKNLKKVYDSIYRKLDATISFDENQKDSNSAVLDPDEIVDEKYLLEPVDSVFKELDQVCNEVLLVSRKLHLSRAAKRISDARRLCRRSGFCVAICGEFSRGKSSLVNSLLDGKIIPTGALPTTRFITRISFAEEERMIWNQEGRRPVAMPATREAWDKLSEHLDEKARGVMSMRSGAKWLQDGIELIDTPGANDFDSPIQTAAIAAIQYSDAALICVSATSPLSQSELTLIQDQVLINEVPRIAIVLTFLDQVAENQKGQVIGFVRKRLEALGIDALVGSNIDRKELAEGELLDFAGPQEIRELLRLWDSDAGHTTLIAQQIRSLMGQACEFGTKELEHRVELSRADREVLKQSLDEKKLTLTAKASTASDLRIEFGERGEKLAEHLEELFLSQKGEILEKLLYELRPRPDPARWFQEDFPYRMKQELKNIGHHAEQTIRVACENDTRWLEGELRRRFGAGVGTPRQSTNLNLGAAANGTGLTDVEFSDLKKLKLRARLLTGAAMAGGWLLMGPLASVMSLGGGIISEKLISKKLEEQRDAVSKRIGEVINATFQDACQIVREQCHHLYAVQAEECLKIANEWEHKETELIEKQLQDHTTSAIHLEDIKTWKKSFVKIL